MMALQGASRWHGDGLGETPSARAAWACLMEACIRGVTGHPRAAANPRRTATTDVHTLRYNATAECIGLMVSS